MLSTGYQSAPGPTATAIMGMLALPVPNPSLQQPTEGNSTSSGSTQGVPSPKIESPDKLYVWGANGGGGYSVFTFDPVGGEYRGNTDFSAGAVGVTQGTSLTPYYNWQTGTTGLHAFDILTKGYTDPGVATYTPSTFGLSVFSKLVQIDDVQGLLLNPHASQIDVYNSITGSLLYTLYLPDQIVGLCFVVTTKASTRVYVLCANTVLVLLDYGSGQVLSRYRVPPPEGSTWPTGSQAVGLYWYSTTGQLFICAATSTVNVQGYVMGSVAYGLSKPIPLQSPLVGSTIQVEVQLVDDLNQGVAGSPIYVEVSGPAKQLGLAYTDFQGRSLVKLLCTGVGSVAINCSCLTPVLNGWGTMTVLTNSTTFTVVNRSSLVTTLSSTVFPSVSFPSGKGRLVHPTLGVYDYDVKPDRWTNMDGDALIMPTIASSKTLQGASSSLWQGNIRDVVCEERWGIFSDLSMPVSQLRMILACAMNPVDPSVAYMQWYPTYNTDLGFNVLLLDVVVGSAKQPIMANLSGFKSQGIEFDDLINASSSDGSGGWVDQPVSIFWRLVSKAVA